MAAIETTVVVLISAGLVASQIYQMPTVNMDATSNSICPPDSHMNAIRTDIADTVSDVLAEKLACGGSGWRRVAFLNMTNPNQTTCPDPWRLYDQNTLRLCGRRVVNYASCDSVIYYNTGGQAYTQVCGRITGYQYGSPDASIHHYHTPTPGNEINEPYLDGVSVTYGNPRKHLWSFQGTSNPWNCCDERHKNNSQALQFIGNNSFCDNGNPNNEQSGNVLFTEDPLWEGYTRCATSATCCTTHSGPWFYTTLPLPTIRYIELRICSDQSTNNEDTPLELIEIYVK